MMKFLPYTIAMCFMFSACSESGLKNQGFPNLEALPESVSINGAGDGIALDGTLSVAAEGDSIKVEVEAPAGTQENITVTYSIGGTATFGTDYTIEGATVSGGTVTVVHDPESPNDFDKGTIVIATLNDLINNEEAETIVITLVSATRGTENIAVGRGGTEYGRTATLTISDLDIVLAFGPTKTISTYENNRNVQIFYVGLSAAISTDLTYDLSSTSPSGLVAPTNYTFTSTSINLGTGLTLEAGRTRDTVSIRLVDNILKTASPMGVDDVNFYIANASTAGLAIPVGGVGIDRDTLTLSITDDVKRYGFTFTEDTLFVTNVGFYEFEVALLSSNRENVPVPSDAEIDIAYTMTPSNAPAGTDEYTDTSAGQITLLRGETTVNILTDITSIDPRSEPVAADRQPATVLTVVLGAATTTDAEVEGVYAESDTLIVKIGG